MRLREDAAHALAEELKGVERPLDAVAALRRVGGRFRPEHLTSWDAFRSTGEKALKPFYDGAAKDVAWATLEGEYGRLADDADRRSSTTLVLEGDERPSPSVRCLAEILADPTALEGPKVVAPRFAYEGRSTLLAGREKDGKSTQGSAIAAAVSAGLHFLGEPCRPGRVLYWALEEPLSDPARRLVAFGCDPSQVFLVDRVTEPLAELRAHVEAVKPALVLIDTLAAFTEPLALDSGSASAWTPVMGEIGRTARDSGAAIILLHHARKSDGKYRDSTAIGAGVDAVLEFSSCAEDASVRRVKARARWHLPEFSVRLIGDPFDLDTRPQYEIAAGGLSVDVRVLLFVEGHAGCSTRDVRSNVTGQGRAIEAALRSLEERDAIRNEPDGAAFRWFPSVEGGNRSGNRSAAEGGSRENPQGTATEPPSGTGLGGVVVPTAQHIRLGGGTTLTPGNRPPPPEVDPATDLDRALGGAG